MLRCFIYLFICSSVQGKREWFTQSEKCRFINAQHPPHMEQRGFRGGGAGGGVNGFREDAILKVSVEKK